jgi:hypothetical protein
MESIIFIYLIHVFARRAFVLSDEAISVTVWGLLRAKNTPALAGGARESALATT